MWPLSTTITTTITSSYGYSSTLSQILSRGLELGNGGILSASSKSSNSSELSFSFDKYISSVTNDPIVSSQFSSSDSNKAEWSFEILNKDVAGKTSYHLDSYYMFEMSKNNVGSNENAFILNYSVLFQGQYVVFLWITYEGWKYNTSLQINCFL